MAGSLRESPTPDKAAEPGLWRSQPYRLFFPAGLLMAWLGVLPWLLGGPGNGAGHSIVQIEGFMMLFAQGFLFTMIPRRSGTPAPSALVLLVGLCGTLLAAVLSHIVTAAGQPERLGPAQVCWLLVLANLVLFAVRRFHRLPDRRLPGLVCLPWALGFAILGSLLFGAYGMLGSGSDWLALHLLGKLFLLQGMFLGLVLGVGSLALPRMTGCQEVDPQRPARGVFVLWMLCLAGTFLVEVFVSLRWGLLLRGLLLAWGLIQAAGLHRRPRLPGLNPWLIWLSAWCLPAGLLAAAWQPRVVLAGLHVLFIGGFAGLALAVSLHVSLSHAGRRDLLERMRWPLLALGILLGGAVLARVQMEIQPADRLLWQRWAAGAFLAASLVWLAAAGPGLFRRPHPA